MVRKTLEPNFRVSDMEEGRNSRNKMKLAKFLIQAIFVIIFIIPWLVGTILLNLYKFWDWVWEEEK